MDAAEEEYFNTSDEEDNAPTPKDSPIKGANGSGSPVPKPLVDYADDDLMDTADESKSGEKGGAAAPTKSALEGASSASPMTSPTTPTSQKPDSDVLSGAPTPERLSEKRRREEEDDDELGKLRNKRRSPTGGSGSVNALTKKRSSGPGGSPPTKKIAINLAVKTSTGGSDGGCGGGGGDVTGDGSEADDEK